MDMPSESTHKRVRHARILVVEDEPALVKLVARMLRSAGYRVETAASVKEAKAIFSRKSHIVDLVFSDMVLSDGNGIDLFASLQQEAPGLRVLFTTGYADERARWRLIEEQGWSCLMKPYTRQTLLSAVEEALHADGETPPRAIRDPGSRMRNTPATRATAGREERTSKNSDRHHGGFLQT